MLMRLPNLLPLSSKLLVGVGRLKQDLLNGKWREAFCHFVEMRIDEFQITDPSLFPSVMKACSNISFTHGVSMHGFSVKHGFEHFTSVGNSTMDFYLKWGVIDAALSVFQEIRNQDSVSWNTIIHGFLDLGSYEDGLCFFSHGRVAGFEPNVATLIFLVHAFRSLSFFSEGQEFHGYLIKNGLLGVDSVQNALLGLYCDFDLEGARQMLNEMHRRDVISWSAMIGGFVQGEEPLLALEVFRDLVVETSVEPDGLTMVSALKACSSGGNINMGASIHGLVISRGFDNDLFVGNSLIDMYSKCSDTHSALRVFNEMPIKNNVSWNSMISGFVHNCMYSEAVELFRSMRMVGIEGDEVTLTSLLQVCKETFEPQQCKLIHSKMIRRGFESNQLLLNSLIDAYSKCNLIQISWELFNLLRSRSKVAWGTIIAGFNHCGLPEQAMAVFHQMIQSGETPNAVIILSLVEAAGSSAELRSARWIHGIATRRGLSSEVAVGTAIVEMYSRCGSIEHSRNAFSLIYQKNIVSWSAMIAAYGMNGQPHKSLALLSEMKQHGLKPNQVTALSVLSACSHGGLVSVGLSFFKEMIEEHKITPGLNHYSCLVDLLSRAGRLESAQELIRQIPEHLKGSSASLWAALLSGCRRLGNVEVGEGAAAQLLELEPWSSAGYLLRTSMHAVEGSWGDVRRIRRMVRDRGVRVVAGYSSVCVDGKGFKFVAGDRCSLHAAQCSDTVEMLHSCIANDETEKLSTFHAE